MVVVDGGEARWFVNVGGRDGVVQVADRGALLQEVDHHHVGVQLGVGDTAEDRSGIVEQVGACDAVVHWSAHVRRDIRDEGGEVLRQEILDGAFDGGVQGGGD